ncbi:hypothetical protein J6O48_08605 [bacterium]|nr:hypothetical protein [bacterium]
MAKLENQESMLEKFEEIKELVSDIKNTMMNGDDCNNQLYSIIQSLDSVATSISKLEEESSKPTDEYTILQTNILEVKKELSNMNKNVDEVFNQDLKALVSKLTEKVNRLEILTNNAGIDQQVIMNITGQVEQNLSLSLSHTTETLNDNMKECVDYIDKSVKAVSADAVQHISDDLTILGTTVEKTTDNLRRSIIDIFTRIQESVEGGVPVSGNTQEPVDTKNFDDNFEMLKNGIYNLNKNTEQRITKLNQIVEELDIFNKLEAFSRLKDLPAIGDLKHSLQGNLNKIVDEYSYTLQTSQNRDELNKATQMFRKDVYNSIVTMLGNVSEFLLENEEQEKNEIDEKLEEQRAQFKSVLEKIDELTSATELNNSGYNNIQIELKDIRERSNNITEFLEDYAKKSNAKKASVEDSINEIKTSVEEIQAGRDALRNQTTEIGEVVRECAKSIIESSEPDRHNIKDMLSDIKKNISILQSGDEETDYTYSMQDIESDVAKIRIYLNELTQNGVSVNSDEFTEELNSIVVMVDSMKQQLNKIDECDLSDTMSKMKEDITSISTRVNKLLLTSDNSYNMIDSALKEFKVLSEEIDVQIKTMANSNKFKNLEDSMTSVKTALAESNNYNSIINQSLIMLAEWVDNAGETITNIYEKQSKLDSIDELKQLINDAKSAIAESSDNVIDSVRTLLEETNTLVKGLEPADYSETLNVLDGKLAEQNVLIEKQEERINKLDEKLSTILEFLAKNDTSELSSKMDDIDAKMNKLNKSIEKLTAYVNED